MINPQKPTAAFIGASWAAVLLGISAYLIGLWNADMLLGEKGYYLTLILYGLFSAISLQKSVRDKHEGIPVTDIYYGLSWFSTIAAIVLLSVGLWNASLALSEKGFYVMSYALSLFAVITVQKNTRDLAVSEHPATTLNGRKTSSESSGKPPVNQSAQVPKPAQTTNALLQEKPIQSTPKPAAP